MNKQILKGIAIMSLGVIMSYSDIVGVSIIGYMMIGSGFVLFSRGVWDD